MNQYRQKYGIKWIFSKTKGTRIYLLILIIAGTMISVVNIGMTIILKTFVDIATGDSKENILKITFFAISFLVLEGVLGVVTSITYRVSVNRIGKKMRIEMEKRFYDAKLLELQQYHTGELMTNVTIDVDKVCECIPNFINSTVGNALTCLFAVFYLFYLNWKLALILLICIPFLIFCVAVFSPIVQRASKKDRENEEQVRVYFQEILEKILILKMSSMRTIIQDKVTSLLNMKICSARNLGIAEGGSSFLNNVLGTSMFLIAIGGGAYFVTRGELVVGAMIAVVQLSNYIIWPFTAIGEIISNVNQAIVSAKRLDRVYSMQAEEQRTELKNENKVLNCLALQNISFCYGEENLFHDITEKFCAGKIIGIIGESGCGKSTLLKIVSGLYEPSSGNVTLEFSDSSISDSIRSYVGLVPSENLIFQGTITENICMAKKVELALLHQCVQMANLNKFISSLPDQFETRIGGGSQALSSGQEQRLAIARVLYQGANIVLFDEPTSNLDQESIKVFLKTLSVIRQNHLCIVVTHDKRVAAYCDQIYELKNGNLSPCHLTEDSVLQLIDP